MKILAIESSCDETAAAVVEDGRKVLSDVVASQIEIHRRFGGVVPEIASRNHTLAIDNVVGEALKNAGCGRMARIVLVASLAALTGLPGSPGYSASKAALRTYGEALRRLTEKEGLSVTVLCPGYIESDMSRRYQGAKPSLMTAETATFRMKNAIEAGRDEYAFPWHLAFGIRLLGLIPKCLQNFFLKGFFFTVVPDEESKAGRVSAMESPTASKEKSERAA